MEISDGFLVNVVKMRVLIAVMIAAAGMMAGDAGGSEMGNGRGGDETQALETFSKASEALYQKVSHSIVRVKVDQIGMPKELQKEFEAFVKKETGGIGTGGGAANGPRKHAEKEEAGPTTVPGRATTRLTLARRFLEQKLKNTTDAELQAKIRLSLGRVEAIHNGRPTREVLGVVIDDQGHTLVASLAREIQAGAGGSGGMLHVMVPDGSDMMAKYVGAHMDRGWVVLKLESLGSSVSAGLAVGRPAPGALLMGMTPQGAVGYITAPGQGKKVEEKFPIVGGGGVGGAGEEHGMTYLFNTQGELAALGAGAGGGTDRQAVTIDSIKEEIDWIIANNKDIQPRRMGVKYDPLTPKMRAETPGLGNRPAVVVREVQAGSPAEKAGLKKNDIVVTIGGKPIWQMSAIQRDLSLQTGGAGVPMEIFREGTEMTIELQFGE